MFLLHVRFMCFFCPCNLHHQACSSVWLNVCVCVCLLEYLVLPFFWWVKSWKALLVPPQSSIAWEPYRNFSSDESSQFYCPVQSASPDFQKLGCRVANKRFSLCFLSQVSSFLLARVGIFWDSLSFPCPPFGFCRFLWSSGFFGDSRIPFGFRVTAFVKQEQTLSGASEPTI